MANGTLKVSNIETSSGSGTITLGQSGETITIPSGCTITNSGTQTGFGGVNTPAVVVHGGTDAYGGSNTWTKVQLDTELLDTESSFDTSNFRWTPQTAGKYFIQGCFSGDASTTSLVTNSIGAIYKNGSNFNGSFDSNYGAYHDIRNNGGVSLNGTVTTIITLNGSSDYIELYGKATYPSGTAYLRSVTLIGYKIVE